MGKSTSTPPPPPDPAEVAAAQGAANVQTAIAQSRLNQVNEYTPFGSSVYTPTGEDFTVKDAEGNNISVPQFNRTMELSPDQQRILDLQNALTQQGYTIGNEQLGRIGDVLGQSLDFSGLPNAPQANEDVRQQVSDALYNRATSYLDPRYEQEQKRLETDLINSGFARDSEGYKNALSDFNRSKGSDYQNALWSSIAGGGSEESRLFGLESAARNQALQELLTQRNQPINELAAILGTSGGVNVPQFSGIPQTGVAGTDIVGPTYASYQGQMDNYNQQLAARNSALGSFASLGGAALGALPWLSDEDAKTGKKPMSADAALRKVQDMPMYDYRYKATGNENAGPVAQDWAAAFGGDGATIEAPHAFGISMAAIKALADKIDRIERRTG